MGIYGAMSVKLLAEELLGLARCRPRNDGAVCSRNSSCSMNTSVRTTCSSRVVSPMGRVSVRVVVTTSTSFPVDGQDYEELVMAYCWKRLLEAVKTG